jgi:hypothetical protein
MGDNNYYEHPASEEPAPRWKGNGRTPDAYFESGPQPWAFEKKIYEWREDYADGGAPADEKLEEELYGEEGRITAGIFFDEFSKVNVSRKGGPENYTPLTSVSFFVLPCYYVPCIRLYFPSHLKILVSFLLTKMPLLTLPLGT